MTKRVAILISGAGSNMVQLVKSMRADCLAHCALVLSNVREAKGLARARSLSVVTTTLDHKSYTNNREAYDIALHNILLDHKIDVICLAGFMRILTPFFISLWANKILNIHPSLLPKYKGLKTHQRVLDAGEKETGCSVHLVTEKLDAGAVLGYASVKVLRGDTADTLADRVLEKEHKLYPLVLQRFLQGEMDLLVFND